MEIQGYSINEALPVSKDAGGRPSRRRCPRGGFKLFGQEPHGLVDLLRDRIAIEIGYLVAVEQAPRGVSLGEFQISVPQHALVVVPGQG